MSASRPSRALAGASLILSVGCARPLPPSPEDLARARGARAYSGRLRVSLKAPSLRARTLALIGFRRPDRLRLEIPGPAGVRLVAVAGGGRLTAVFPADQAVFQGGATERDLEALLGVALTPEEVMDLLVGAPSPRLRAYRADWRMGLPREIAATLPDGASLKATVEEAELDPALPEAAFAEPPHDGYRQVDAEEARSLWEPRRR